MALLDRIPPRLSTVISILGGFGAIDVDEVQKRAALRSAKPSGAAQNEGALSWEEFSREARLGPAGEDAPAREALRSFSRLAGELGASVAGPGTASDRVLLEALSSGSVRDARRDVELIVGKVHDAQWRELHRLAVILQDWKKGRRATASDSSLATKWKWGGDLAIPLSIAQEDALLFAFFEPQVSLPANYHSPADEAKEISTESGPYADAAWLFESCGAHVSQGTSGLGAADLAISILGVLEAGANDPDALQGQLFDLLGEGGFDLMASILDRRTGLLSAAEMGVASQWQEPGRRSSSVSSNAGPLSAGSRVAVPSVGTSFSIVSESEKAAEKRRRKEAKRKLKAGGANGAQYDNDTLPSWLTAPDPTPLDGEQLDFSHLMPEGSREYHEKRGGLPAGATKTHEIGQYEMVHIPAPLAPPKPPPGDLVSITSLEPWAQSAFPGTRRLNRMQSKVFLCAYNSAENMLICAPTGAGKTNVAMLALLQQVRRAMQSGELKTMKAIYVAPMKALAQEVVSKFGSRLKALKLVVREFTGDTQLSRAEVEAANLIVTTPEKWDVVTRKGGDGTLATMVSLVIIDEVHLLADDRGAVIESIVARMQRHMEMSQRLIRIVGLSATLPNYRDVATFLGVNHSTGLFYFGPEFRPVPLEQTFIGITEKQHARQLALMNRVAYQRTLESLRAGNQVMVFVHARKDTIRTAQAILELAARDNTVSEFSTTGSEEHSKHAAMAAKSQSAELRQLFDKGLGCHHAGMPRRDRSLTERAFEDGALRVLVCTATLAWGVNLPAHTVIIKGTEVYNPEKGGVQDLSMLDVLQIFGRAGRPQYDTSGEAIMITKHASLDRYLALLARQTPIESTFIKSLPDHLNAEIASGTVTNLEEAVSWLGYTYLYVRLTKNPMAYGITLAEAEMDPRADGKRRELVRSAAATLDEHRMARHDRRSGNLATTDLGRTASHYYIQHESVLRFNSLLSPHMTPAKAMRMLCQATEFEQIKVRPEELKEIDLLRDRCPLDLCGPVEDASGKANVLLQGFIAGVRPTVFTLASDALYVAQNAGRIARALFEIALRKGWGSLAADMLSMAKSIDRRVWWFKSPLRQFAGELPSHSLDLLDPHGVDDLLDMSAGEVGQLCHSSQLGDKVLWLSRRLPKLSLQCSVQPITRGILRVTLLISADFVWDAKWHGSTDSWWVWVEDDENERVYHSEHFILTQKTKREEHTLSFSIPVFEPLPTQYWVRVLNDRWVGCDGAEPLPFKHLVLPDRPSVHTALLDLTPLPVSALGHASLSSLYPFSHFNAIQTQLFHVLYHTDHNVLLGAPTGSGKTAVAEIALLRQRRLFPNYIAVYVAPLKALARERLREWRKKLTPLGISVVEMTGDVSPDAASLKRAHLIITTPEKWDLVTRSWRSGGISANLASRTALLIMDEIHLLGEERGPVLEAMVTRARFVAEQTGRPLRFVGLSTALANPQDLGDWLGISRNGPGMYNFRPSVRPIPCEVHIQGYPDKNYCPRMASMNRPAFAAILEHSPDKPVLIFVASRRQTRLTAMDLISLAAATDTPKRFLRMPEDEAEVIAATVKDPSLRHALTFGVGMHHAGLVEGDRDVVEMLFARGALQVLVCTATLAWGVNFPAHLVIVKGTEFFDAKEGRYVDFPVTDVLQMVGRAGRPQFDTHAVAVILVHAPKKNFYKRFMYEPFPVESQLVKALHNILNAEVAGGSVRSISDAIDYLTWTYLFRRLVQNPSYYQLEDASPEAVQGWLMSLVSGTLVDLEAAGCVELSQDTDTVITTPLGCIASRCYLDYRTVDIARGGLAEAGNAGLDIVGACRLIADAEEFAELPVRHNEDKVNAELGALVRFRLAVDDDYASPHGKAFLLLQAHFGRTPLPMSDYVTDTRTVLDQASRVAGGMAEMAGEEGRLASTLQLLRVQQMMVQACWDDDDPLLQVPGITPAIASDLHSQGIKAITDILRGGRKANDFMERLGQHKQKERAAFLSSVAPLALRYEVLEEGASLLVKLVQTHKTFGRVPAPRFSKAKQLGWWLLLGCKASGELLAMKRLGSVLRDREEKLCMKDAGKHPSPLTLFLIADSVLGLDQQIELI